MDQRPPLEQVCLGRDPRVVCPLGTCIENACVECAPGWTHGLAYYHIQDCGEPELFVPIFAGINIVYCLLLQPSLYRRLIRAKNQARIVLWGAQISNLAIMLSFISLWAQRHSSVVFWFGMALAVFALSVSRTTMMMSYGRLVYHTAHEPYPERASKWLFRLNVFALSFPYVGVAFPGSFYIDRDPVFFNTMLAVATLLTPMHLLLSTPLLHYAVSSLMKSVKKSIDKETKGGHHREEGVSPRRAESADSPREDRNESPGWSLTRSLRGTSFGSPSPPLSNRVLRVARKTRMERLYARLRLFQRSMFIIHPLELVTTASIALSYLVGRAAMSWIPFMATTGMLQACVWVFTFASVDNRVDAEAAFEGRRHERDEFLEQDDEGAAVPLSEPRRWATRRVSNAEASPALTAARLEVV